MRAAGKLSQLRDICPAEKIHEEKWTYQTYLLLIEMSQINGWNSVTLYY